MTCQAAIYLRVLLVLLVDSIGLSKPQHRGWLLGRNPWGVSQFGGIPSSGGMTPLYPYAAATLQWPDPINGG